ncbi:MAG: Yip1 family protein [Halanaeroarchaeum sp.]
MVLDVFTDPDGFFEERADRTSAWMGLLVVILATAVQAVTGILQVQRLLSGTSEVGTVSVLFSAATVVVSFLAILVGWVLVALVFYAATAFSDAERSFGETLAIAGWGYAPLILGGIVSAVLVYVALGNVTPPELHSVPQGNQSAMQDAMQANAEAIDEFFSTLRDQTAYLVSAVLGIGFTLWQGWIWSAGLRRVVGLDRRRSFVVAGIPVAIAILWTIRGLA